MKSYLVILGALLLTSTSHARLVSYTCVSYQNKSEQVSLNIESSSLEINGIYKGQQIAGRSTNKVKPNIHLPFISNTGEELELYLDVKAKVLSVTSAEGVVFQARCF